MPPAVGEFWTTLIRLGLLDPVTAKALARQVPSSAESADAALESAKFLIAQGVLTKFQAKRLLAQRGGELRQGEYLVLERCEQPPLSRWLRARHLPTGALTLIYPCSAARDAKQPLDLGWLRAHIAVAADGLQPLASVQLAGSAEGDASWRGLVVSALPAGQTLTEWLRTHGTMDSSGAIALGQVLGGALAAMHAASLIHGGVRPGRVWIGNDATVYLLRCGGGPPIDPDLLPAPAYDWFEDDGRAPDFASPQWLSGQGQVSVQDDVYSLGAVLYTALRGQAVATGTLPADVAEAVAAGAAGDPLLRVLAAALAAEPASRFADVLSMLRALDAVAALHAQTPVSQPPAVPQTVQTEPSTPSPQPVVSALRASTAAPAEPVDQPTDADDAVAAESADSQSAAIAEPAPVPSRPATTAPAQAAASDAVSARSVKPQEIELKEAGREASIRTEASHGSETPGTPAAPASGAVPVRPAAARSEPVKPQSAPQRPAAPRSAAPVQPTAARPQAPAGSTPQPAAVSELPEVAIQTVPAVSAESAPGRRKRTRRSRRGPIIVGSASIAVLLLLVGGLLRAFQSGGEPAPRPVIQPPLPPSAGVAQGTPSETGATGGAGTHATAPAATAATGAAAGGFELVQDDRLLWAPPWPADSPPPPLDLVTPGAQIILALRPSALLRSDAAADWRGWFGPELDPVLQSLEQRCSVSPDQMQRLVISLLPGRDGEPVASFAVWLAEPLDRDTLLQRWKAEASRTPEGQTLYSGEGEDAYFIAAGKGGATQVSAFAVGPVEHMKLVAEGGGGPIPLSRPLELAWNQSSDQAELVALISPNFLFADGRKLLQRHAPAAISPLRDLLIPHVTAALVTWDTSDAWYGEIRLVPGGTSSPAALLRTVQERATELPGHGETFVIQHEIPASWRALAIRLPQYLRAIDEQTRFGISQSLPTINFYLPVEAAPQVTLASLLALSSSGTASGPSSALSGTMAGPAAGSPPAPLSIDQLLDTPLSISFDQESLETAVAMIGEEFVRSLPEGAASLKITIVGGDLEKSGITQNQQVRDFQMRNVPLRGVLTQLVLGANSDKTATGPSDPKQTLIWVVDPAATPSAPGLLITTRPQAEAKGYALPQEFVAP